MAQRNSTHVPPVVNDALGGGFTDAVRLTAFRPRYEIAGRRADGSVAGRRRMLWLAGRTLLFLRNVVIAVVTIVLAFFDADPDLELRRSRYRVRGQRNGAALGFADANRRDQWRVFVPELWLVSSPTQAALVRLNGARVDVLWSMEGADRPRINYRTRIATWPDGSVVEWDRPIRVVAD